VARTSFTLGCHLGTRTRRHSVVAKTTLRHSELVLNAVNKRGLLGSGISFLLRCGYHDAGMQWDEV